MNRRTLDVIHRGIDCALVASIPQVLVPKLEEKLFLRKRESADVGPHFIEAIAEGVDQPLPEDVKWIAASGFHFGYAAAWGASYALAQEKLKMRPWIGGLALGSLIHLITFPAWGGAVLSGAEKKPRDRPWRMEVVMLSAPLVFGFCTALLYGRGPRER